MSQVLCPAPEAKPEAKPDRTAANTFFEQTQCAGCHSTIPLDNIEDVVLRNRKTRERVRRVTHRCESCGQTRVARFRLVGVAWRLIRRVKVIANTATTAALAAARA